MNVQECNNLVEYEYIYVCKHMRYYRNKLKECVIFKTNLIKVIE